MLLVLGLFFFAFLSVLQAKSLEVANEDEKEAAAVVTKNTNLLVAEDLLQSELLQHSLKRRSPSAYEGSLRLRRSPIPSPYVPRSWLRGRGRSSSYSCSTCGGETVLIVQNHIELEKSNRRWNPRIVGQRQSIFYRRPPPWLQKRRRFKRQTQRSYLSFSRKYFLEYSNIDISNIS